MEQLVKRYNECIEELVLASNLGFAAEIDQADSALEKHYMAEQVHREEGVADLKSLQGDNDNVFNRVLAYLH